MNSPMLPESVSSSSQWKAFWAKPEGKMGVALLAVLAGLGIYAWGSVTAFLVTMLADTVHIIMLAGLIFAMLWVVFSKRSHMLFRLLSRYLTGLIINIDPVGIVEDKIQQMKKRREQFGEQVTNVAGQKRFLEDVIDRNRKEASKNMANAVEAKKLATETTDAERALRMQLQTKLNANKAARRQQSNIGYQALLAKITALYEMLTKWTINMDFFIEDTEDQVTQMKTENKVTNSAYNAIKTGMAIIRGNADENDIYDRAQQRLMEDTSNKLGAIEDFQRVAQNFMDTIDVQNGAVDAEALAKLDEYQQKLLTNGSPDTQFLIPAAGKVPQPIPVTARKSTGYDDLLK